MTSKIIRKSSNTCLAVIREDKGPHKGKLIFAGDRRISWGMGGHQVGVRPKICKRNGVLFAGTGSAYLCDLICELCDVPPINKDIDGFNYIHRYLYDSVKSTLINKGLGDKENGILIPDEMHAVILIGVKGELFEMGISDVILSLDAIGAPFAHGCGGQYALGSLITTEKLKISSEKRLQIALGVAAKLSPGCDGNIDIIREWDKDTH